MLQQDEAQAAEAALCLLCSLGNDKKGGQELCLMSSKRWVTLPVQIPTVSAYTNQYILSIWKAILLWKYVWALYIHETSMRGNSPGGTY